MYYCQFSFSQKILTKFRNLPVGEMDQKDYDFPKFLRLLLFSADFLLIPLSVYKKTKVLQYPQDSSEGPELLSFDSGAEYHSQGKQCEVCVETAFQGQGLYKILDKKRGVKSMIR